MKVTDLANQIEQSPELQQQMKDDPVAALRRIQTPLATDPWIYRSVVGFLGLIAMMGMGGSLYLALVEKSAPEGVIALGSTALGALAGLLVLPRSN